MDELDSSATPLEPQTTGAPSGNPEGPRPDGPEAATPRSPSACGSGSASRPQSSSWLRCSTRRRAVVAVSHSCCVEATSPCRSCVGQPQAQAEALITASGLRVGQVSEVDTLAVPPGTVVQQSPAPDTKVKADSAVDIAVSAVPQVQVPDVTGKTESAASETLAEQGLRIGTIELRVRPRRGRRRHHRTGPEPEHGGRGGLGRGHHDLEGRASRAWSRTWSAWRRAMPSPPSRVPASSRRARRRRAPASPPVTSSASPRRPAWSRRPAAPSSITVSTGEPAPAEPSEPPRPSPPLPRLRALRPGRAGRS